ncbi:MAG TPA: glycosyltransferase family 2 protein [Mucilaginibacter sp.]|nr:glycosyltransferase family 2 protein [Mucilaginibacter sp.]
MPTLALCIPAYNAEKYLPKLLQSAKAQAIPFDEILVYNDCSTDDTAQVAEQYGAKVVNGDINRGCSYGKNALAGVIKSDWVHFHDADDDLLPEFTKLVHQWINNSGQDQDVLLLNFDYIDFASGALLGRPNHNVAELQKDPLRYAIKNKIVNFGVYRLSSFLAAGGFDLDENVLYNEDNAFHQRLAKQGLKFDYLPGITCINYRYQASMSASNRLKCARANYHVLAKTASTHGDIYPQELAGQLWICIASLASCQDWSYVRKALALTKKLGYRSPSEGDQFFRNLARIYPFLAVWTREKIIRLFKPHLRK